MHRVRRSLNPRLDIQGVGLTMFDNRNIFDFRAVHSMSGGPHLSMVWQQSWDGADQGSGLVLGNDYTIQRQLRYPPASAADPLAMPY